MIGLTSRSEREIADGIVYAFQRRAKAYVVKKTNKKKDYHRAERMREEERERKREREREREREKVSEKDR